MLVCKSILQFMHTHVFLRKTQPWPHHVMNPSCVHCRTRCEEARRLAAEEAAQVEAEHVANNDYTS